VLQVKTPRGNLYLVLGDAVTAVDPNLPGEWALVEDALRGEGLSLADLDFVTCTHLHFDHASGLDDLATAAGATLLLSETQRPYLDGSTPYPFPGLKFWWPFLDVWGRTGFAGVSRRQLRDGGNIGYPWSDMRPRTEVSRWLPIDEAAPELGGLVVVPCPGHTPEQVGFMHRETGLLLAGDMYLTARGRIELNRIVLDREAQAASDRRLRELGLRVVAPGHGPVMTL
jgi:glyoxylase-like metal-dependent hydrolase (beta-lactamase superfamily II)